MKLSTLSEDSTPKIGDMVHSRVKFYVQWSVGNTKNEHIPIKPFWMGPNSMGKIKDIKFEKGRMDGGTEDTYTVTMEFLYGGLNKKGSIGMANGPTLDSIVKSYLPTQATTVSPAKGSATPEA